MSIPVNSAPPWRQVKGIGTVSAVAAFGEHVVAGLDDGGVIHSSDGGLKWKTLGINLPYPAASLVLDEGGIWAGTPLGLHRALWSSGWQAVPGIPPHIVVTALAARDALFIAGTLRSGIFRSDDGRDWEQVSNGLPLSGAGLHIHAVVVGDREVFVAHALGVSRSRDRGKSWATAGIGLPLYIPRAVLVASGMGLFAGIAGRLYRTALSQLGESLMQWKEVWDGEGGSAPLTPLGGAEGQLFAAVPQPPYLMQSFDEGLSWNGIGHGLPHYTRSLIVVAAHLLAVLEDGSLWRLPRSAAAMHTAATVQLSAPVHLDVRQKRSSEGGYVAFELREPSNVLLAIFDMKDHEVARLSEDRFEAGMHQVPIGSGTLAPGIYRCRLRVGLGIHAVSFILQS